MMLFSYQHPWAEIVEISWRQSEGPYGSFLSENSARTCFTPPDVDEMTEIRVSIYYKDSAGNEDSIDFDITVFPEEMYEENYEGPPDGVDNYCH